MFGPVVPEMPLECPMTDRGFFYIQIKSEESLQVFDWFDYLLEDSIFFCVWHCLPVWSVGCAVRYIGSSYSGLVVRFVNIHEHNAPYL